MLQDLLMSNLINSSALGPKIRSDANITEKGKYALDATDKNPNIDGTMASEIKELKAQTEYIKGAINGKGNDGKALTKLSQLQNDSGFVTDTYVTDQISVVNSNITNLSNDMTGKISSVDNKIVTKTSQLQNDSGFVTDTYVTDQISVVNSNITNLTRDINNKADKENPVFTGSFSMGRKADTTIGISSHAEGYNTEASKQCSHAEGTQTTASGSNSHAEGCSTTASGESSHAEGERTYATGNYSHVEGAITTASGNYSHAEGNGTTASGETSHAEGGNTIASGSNSHAEGGNTIASGHYSHAEGISSNNASAILGDASTTLSVTQLKEKYKTTKFGCACGEGSHSEGKDCFAGGDNSHAEGNSTSALGNQSHSEGLETTASGSNSHAEGGRTTASGGNSHAEGSYAKASGSISHAEGISTTASGNNSHAEGSTTTASGNNSHAEGSTTTASGNNSHAEGGHTEASGDISHAEGYNTTASNYASHAGGKFNAYMATGGATNNTIGTAFVIGNGTSSSARSNAFSVQFDGTVRAKSTITASTTADYAEFFEWEDGNPEGEDRVGYFVTLKGKKLKLATNKDSYILGVVSGEPFVLGNGDCDTWNGMFLRDEYRRTIYEPAPKMELIEITEEKEETYTDEETGEEKTRTVTVVTGHEYKEVEGEYEGTRPVLNPDYDSTKPYVSRFERKEWAPIGMLGVLAVRHDGTAKVDGYVTVNKDGIATACEEDTKNSYRVIGSNSDTVVEIIFR